MRKIMIFLELCFAEIWIFHSNFGFFWPKPPRDPSDDLGRSFGIIFSSKFQHQTMWVNHFHVFCLLEGPTKHENRTFRASLEPWGHRDPPYVQERQILFRIALTRALYDQMASEPQLCPFYVPSSGPPGGLSGKIWIWRPQREDLDLSLIHI